MEEKKNERLIKLAVTLLVVIILVWFIVIHPLVKFKNMEKEVKEATQRYFEINNKQLPTGKNSKRVSLNELYKKDFIIDDLKSPYTSKYCDSDNSWGRVVSNNGEYEYSVYLKCGVFESQIDHVGPIVKLNGEDEITVYQNTKYKELGVESVSDNTDGKMEIKNVVIDSSNVNTSKVGKYEVTYTISDSLNNKTIKKRIVNVTQTLNNIVETNTDKTNIYKGMNEENYIILDGITFKIVGINPDKSVKIVSSEPLGAVNYDGIDSWLNDNFYEKLSDSAKEYIVKSKWCVDQVSNTSNYKECNKYSKKKYSYILSVSDYNNAKDKDDTTNLDNSNPVWTSNSKATNKYYVNSYFDLADGGLQEFKEFNKEEIFNIKPALNIKKDSIVISGDGSSSNPYRLKGNKNKNRQGSKISNVKTGTYILYSGYVWRVIGKDEDSTTEVIMIDTLAGDNGSYYSKYSDKIDYYNPKNKNSLAYNIVNKATSYIKTNYFVKKDIQINEYKDKVLYNKSTSKNNYNLKLREISLFDLYSPITNSSASSWYQEMSKSDKKSYINNYISGTITMDFDVSNEYSVRLVGYLNKDVVIKDGKGTIDEPYTITK